MSAAPVSSPASGAPSGAVSPSSDLPAMPVASNTKAKVPDALVDGLLQVKHTNATRSAFCLVDAATSRPRSLIIGDALLVEAARKANEPFRGVRVGSTVKMSGSDELRKMRRS